MGSDTSTAERNERRKLDVDAVSENDDGEHSSGRTISESDDDEHSSRRVVILTRPSADEPERGERDTGSKGST